MNSKLLAKVSGIASSNATVLSPYMKRCMLVAVTSTIVIGSTTAVFAATYKTLSNQVVVTGLQPKTKYPVQTTNFSDKGSTRTVTTNGCGEALITNGTGYRRLIINKQTIIPASLPTQSHPRCNPKRNSGVTSTHPQQPINK